jgi:hypothetical protein
MQSPKDKAFNPPGGRAAERLRDFLEKRLPPGEAQTELDDRTNIKPERQKAEPQKEKESNEKPIPRTKAKRRR